MGGFRSGGWRSNAAYVRGQVRRRDPELSDAMDREEAEPGWRMPDEMLARLDAWLHGRGYLVHGRRVDPASVTIVEVPSDG